ncbi:MAG: response regulator transcription factor [Gammaproteobacteria bacterium]|nr:response regulator transcription factor [Gammaproteobacteria bacterium]MCC6302988.1 response regulator transcription factor [Gammaproteobacteria bacterium]
MRLLLVEDDDRLSAQLRSDLGRAGYAVDVAGDGERGEFLGDTEPYDVIVLDLGLPRRPGLQVLANWRGRGNRTPVIVLTARDAWHERVEGFKAGADDYLGKPFHVEELLARLAALIKRSKGQGGGRLRSGSLALDEERQCAIRGDGEPVALTGTEFRLLRYFMLHPNRILSKSTLGEHVYDYDGEKDSNVLEVYVNRLRQKLGPRIIVTRRGQGYVFAPPE